MFKNKKKCFKRLMFWTIMGTFLSSLITMVLVIIMAVKTGIFQGGAQGTDFLISKKYDKGQSIEKALKTEKPMLVWFYTDWCGYCKRFAPTFGKINKDNGVKKDFAIAYVNCDKPESAKYMQEFNVQGFPTVYMVKGEAKKIIENEKLFTQNSFEKIKEELNEFKESLDDD